MPLPLQAKLLRVLQEKNIRRIGDNKLIPVDVRVISATNVSMKQKIAEAPSETTCITASACWSCVCLPCGSGRRTSCCSLSTTSISSTKRWGARFGG